MITENYVSFFKSLEKNNNRAWFQGHKKAYKEDVKKPFVDLLNTLIPELIVLEPTISPHPKDALFRINRDIRFSKDKTPYNTLLKAGFSPGGKKTKLPGFYLGISADTIHVGGGLFNVSGADLKGIRSLIAENSDVFIKTVNSEPFIKCFKELKGEQAKRLDKTFQPTLSKTPYIANKQFYAMQELPLNKYLNSNELPSIIMHAFKTINPLNQFLKKAFL